MEYLLNTDLERRRLELQAKLLDPHSRRALERAGVAEGKTVLDIGSGAGDVTLLAAELAGPSGRIVGVDLEQAMVDHARARAMAAGHRNVEFAVVSPLLDEVDGTFDAVVARLVLLFHDDKAAVLRRMAELVKPGGTLTIIDSSWTTQTLWSRPAVPCYDDLMAEFLSAFDSLRITADMGSNLIALFDEAGLDEPVISAELITGGKASGVVEYVVLCGEVVIGRAEAGSASARTPRDWEKRRRAILDTISREHSQFFGPCMFAASITR